MIKYVKLREATELPCMHCGKNETPVFLVEELPHKKKQTHYMCESCFNEFKNKNSDMLKEYFEGDLAKILAS